MTCSLWLVLKEGVPDYEVVCCTPKKAYEIKSRGATVRLLGSASADVPPGPVARIAELSGLMESSLDALHRV